MTNINDIKQICDQEKYLWFKNDAMKFLNTNIESNLFVDIYFITSENTDIKRFSIRKWDVDRTKIETVGEIGEHASFNDAMIKLEHIIKTPIE
jgi:hypothetical protein